MKAEKIIEEIEQLDDSGIMMFDFNECFTYMRVMEYTLQRILRAHEHSSVDWEAMHHAKKLLDED